MPYDVKILSVPYGHDDKLNLFSDFSRLEMRGYRDQATQAVVMRYFLTGSPNGRPEMAIPESEISEVLANYFMQSAHRSDGIPVVELPPPSITVCCSGVEG